MSFSVVTRNEARIGIVLGLMTEQEARTTYNATTPRPGQIVQLVRVVAVERGQPSDWEMLEEKTAP